MKINLQDIYSIDSVTKTASLKAINLYPYLMHAIDVYVMCESTDKYKWLMEPSKIIDPDTGSITYVPKISISIDGTLYPISAGFLGESPMNPITFTKGNYNIELEDGIGYIGTPKTGYVEERIESDENVGGRNIGTNIMIDNDYLAVNIIINDPSLIVTTETPFGGAKEVNGIVVESYDGFGGAKDEGEGLITSIEGFGGVPPSSEYLRDIIVVIEKSQFINDLNNRDIGPGVQNYGIRY